MKKRAFNLLNFLALNILFFALYLNFIHKDTNSLPAVSAAATTASKRIAANDFKTTAAVTPQKQKTVAN